jgi:hypothetical protein
MVQNVFVLQLSVAMFQILFSLPQSTTISGDVSEHVQYTTVI